MPRRKASSYTYERKFMDHLYRRADRAIRRHGDRADDFKLLFFGDHEILRGYLNWVNQRKLAAKERRRNISAGTRKRNLEKHIARRKAKDPNYVYKAPMIGPKLRPDDEAKRQYKRKNMLMHERAERKLYKRLARKSRTSSSRRRHLRFPDQVQGFQAYLAAQAAKKAYHRETRKKNRAQRKAAKK